MAQTQAKLGVQTAYTGSIHEFFETGTANTTLASQTPAMGQMYRLVYCTVAYSAAPTQTGITIKINSAQGASYDAVISTGAANAQFTFFQAQNDLLLGPNDKITVTAPAGGVGITAAVVLKIEKL